MSRKKDTRYLKQRGDGLWLVQLAVPRALRKALGKEIVEKSLRTADYATAIGRRDEVVANIRDTFAAASRGRPKEADLAIIDLWQRLADAGFYRPADGFTYHGRRYRLVRSNGERSTWITTCGRCLRKFSFESPGRFPPRHPRRTCGCKATQNKRT